MFNSSAPHLPQVRAKRTWLTVTLSLMAHTAMLVTLVSVSVLSVSSDLPKPNEMLAFVAPAPLPAPPAPAPAARAPARQASPAKAAAPETPAPQTPVEAPQTIETKAVSAMPPDTLLRGIGGMPDGVIGGVSGGTGTSAVLTPPPPPPPPKEPVHIGGNIKAPALLSQTQPEYPGIALRSHMAGRVVVEATVAPTGSVEAVRVVESGGLFDQAALDAVRKWRYAPLLLNGTAMPFVLTVTVTFGS